MLGLAASTPGVAATPEDLGRSDTGDRKGPRFVPGELLVRYRHGVTRSERAELRDKQGAELEERLPLARAELVELGPGASVRDAVDGFEGHAGVAYAEPNFIRQAAAIPNDEFFEEEWGLNNTGQIVQGNPGDPGTPDADIDAPEAWEVTMGSDSVTVAVIDTGIAHDHPDLDGNIWTNPGEIPANGIDDDANGSGDLDPLTFIDDVRGWDFVDNDNDPVDENGHGTHVAGTIGAEGNNTEGVTGVNWNVSLMPLRILDAFGSGTTADSIEAIRYADANGADVVNGSYSGGGFSTMEKDAIDAASDVLFVFAAGNDGTDNDSAPQTPCSYASPNILCVAASDQDDHLAGFSNFGATSVDLTAPGTTVASTYPYDEKFFDGFEFGPGGFTTGGTNNTWALTQETFVSPTHSLTDSPGTDYVPSTDSFAQRTGSVNLSGESSCELRSRLLIDTATGDFLRVEASGDNASWTTLASFDGLDDVDSREHLGTPFLAPTVFLRYRFESDADVAVGDGAYVDDAQLVCDEFIYAFVNGTSMATPHVAGTAGLLFADNPGASVAQVRDSILNSVDQKNALCGKVATAGRLNAARALAGEVNPPPCPPAPAGGGSAGDTAPPDTQITSGPKDRTKKKTATFEFTSTEPGSSFACAVDAQTLKAPCASPFTVRVKKGKHTFQVRATDPSGNADPTPASDSWKRKKKKKGK